MTDFLNIGGVRIPVAPGGGRADENDAVDRRRAFDNTYRASATGNAKRDWSFSTPPLERSLADFYRSVLKVVTAQVCSGDVLGGSQNLVLQSENFLSTWTLNGTPVRTPGPTVGGVTLETIADDSAAALEGYEQVLGFTGNGVKSGSLFVRQETSTSSVIRLIDNTVPADRLVAILTWAGALPVVTLETGTFLGYDTIGAAPFTTNPIYRLRLASTSVIAANVNQLGIYPATPRPFAVANTGLVDVGGVQFEDSATPTPYVKTTTATVDTRNPNCFAEVTGSTPVKTAAGHRLVLDFQLHEA